MAEYEVKPVEAGAAELAAARGLFSAAFPHATHLDEPYLDWQYNQNPVGKVVGFNAWHSETLAGHYVTLPLEVTWDGRAVRGLLSLNTATHPAHQGKGLFTGLAETTYRRGAELGFEFVIGVANANSTPGFVKKLGFELVAPLEARLGVGPVVRHPSPEPRFSRRWSVDALRWRLRNPHGRYRVVTAGAGLRVEAPTGKGGIQAILAELGVGCGLQPSSSLWRPLNPVKLWLGLDPRIDWSRTRYWPVPRRLRPSPLNLIFKDLTGAGRRLEPGAVRFEAMDFDPY